MKKIPPWAMVFCAIAILLSGLFFLPSPEKPREPVVIDVQLSADVHGRLEPCGCFTGQLGGLTRMKTLLESHRNQGIFIRVDAGDSFAGHRDDQVLHAKYLLEGFATMDFDGVNLGRREAQLTAKELEGLAQNSPVPLISSNLRKNRNGEAIHHESLTLVKDGFKIGLTGIVDPVLLRDSLGDGLKVEDIDSALLRVLENFEDDLDLRVLLAFCDESRMRQIADRFPEFDLILGGAVPMSSQEVIHQNRSLILFTTNESRTLAWMQAKWTPGIGLREQHYDILMLHGKIPQDPHLIDLSRTFRKELAVTPLKVDRFEDHNESRVPGTRAKATYVGSKACAGCHPSSFNAWKKTPHAHAFETLKQQNASMDPQCIRCHTVGFGEPSGYQRSFKGKRLAGVGCESCHGPGSEHVARRASGQPVHYKMRQLGEGSCLKCHYGEFSRPFDWKTFWPHVQHGKEGDPGTLHEL